jgi:dienelactone hydrolase
MGVLKNIRLKGAEGRAFLLDVYFKESNSNQPVIVFSHGFKGFKDWGHWSLIANAFAEAGFVFITYNFSHNGTTVNAPLDFDDLEAFGQNNFSKELSDLNAVLDWLASEDCVIPENIVDREKIAIIGHSRGGALSIIKAARDERIKALVTWASVNKLDYAWGVKGFIERWREKGVYHVLNGRTGQQMPLYFQLFEDFMANQPGYDTQEVLKEMDKPYLILHGTSDPGVDFQSARDLHAWSSGSQLHLIEGADHVFGGRHPFEGTDLPEHTKELVEKSIRFLEANL